MNESDRTLAVLASVFLFASLAHGWAHVTIPVSNARWQLAFVGVVLFLAPLAGVALLVSGRRRVAAWTLLLASLAGLVFEGLFHFVISNPDHVGSVENGAALFANTAVLSTAGDLALVLGAGWFLWRQAQGSSSNSPIASMR